MSLSRSVDQLRRDRVIIEEMINKPETLGVEFQPIKSLGDSTVTAYKATAKGPDATMSNALELLQSAQAAGLVERLDWQFRAHAFDLAVQAQLKLPLFITPEPETYGSMCPPRLITSFGRGRRELKVVAEVPAAAFADSTALRRGIDEIRGYGWQVVADDVADTSGGPGLVEEIRPEYVKLDMSLAGRTATPAGNVRTLLDAAQRVGATLMAINVDSEPARAAAQQLGATVGRGRLLGAPGPLPSA
ncbi:MAG: EAL domain-containing protein [Mycobacteriales bacterium]